MWHERNQLISGYSSSKLKIYLEFALTNTVTLGNNTRSVEARLHNITIKIKDQTEDKVYERHPAGMPHNC